MNKYIITITDEEFKEVFKSPKNLERLMEIKTSELEVTILKSILAEMQIKSVSTLESIEELENELEDYLKVQNIVLVNLKNNKKLFKYGKRF